MSIVQTGDTLVATFAHSNGFQAQVTIVQNPNGTLTFTVEVTSLGGVIGDLRALYWDFANDLAGTGVQISALDASGQHITDEMFRLNNVTSLGGDTSMSGSVLNMYGRFDAGVEFGTQGIGQNDIRSTTFTLSANVPLTLDMVAAQDMGLRVTSVGPDGSCRNGSLKLGSDGAVFVPDPDSGTVDALDNSYTVGETEDVAANILADDLYNGALAQAGELKVVQVVYMGLDANGQPVEKTATIGASPVTLEVVTVGGRTGMVTIDQAGNFSFDGDDNFLELLQGQQDAFQIAYTVETPAQVTRTITTDFTNYARGAAVDNQIPGVSIWAVKYNDVSGRNAAMIFDADNPTGGDTDLGVAGRGEILIITEDFDASDPDDNASGGTFFFQFDNPSTIHSLTFVDTEESTNPVLKFYDAQGNLITQMAGLRTGNGQAATQTFGPNGIAGVARLEVFFCGSGGLDDLVFTQTMAQEVLTDTAFVNVYINGEGQVDLLPVARADSLAVDEGASGSVNILANDDLGDLPSGIVDATAPDGSAFAFGTAKAISTPFGDALVTLEADGTVTLDASSPAFAALKQGQSTSFQITYRLCDADGDISTTTVTLTINGLNEGPVANPDGNYGPETARQISGNVLANDFDGDGDALTVTGFGGQVPGKAITVSGVSSITGTTYDAVLVMNADGSYTLHTAPVFEDLLQGETVSFTTTYTIRDAFGATAGSTLSITINGASQVYVVDARDDAFSVGETEDIGPGYEGPNGENANIIDDDLVNGELAGPGELVVTDVQAVSAGNSGQGAVGSSFTVTTAGGRTGTVTVNADGSFSFDGGTAFEDLLTGQTDSFRLAYTVAKLVPGQNLLVNGDFESHPALTRSTSLYNHKWDVFDTIPGWYTPVGNLEIQSGMHSGTPYNPVGNSILEVDSHDQDDTNASVQQDVVLDEAGTYVFSFDYSPRAHNGQVGQTSVLNIWVNGQLFQSVTKETLGYERYSFELELAAGVNTIGFSGGGTDDTYGALVDNVQLRGLVPGASDTAYVDVVINGEGVDLVPVAADDAIATTEAAAAAPLNILTDAPGADTAGDGPLAIVAVAGAADNPANSSVTVGAPDANGVRTIELSVTDMVDGVPVLRTATATLAADGTLTLDPGAGFQTLAAGEFREWRLAYTVADADGDTDSATITLRIDGLNEGPDAVDDANAADETVVMTGNILGNDTDPNGDALTVTHVRGEPVGTELAVSATLSGGRVVEGTVVVDAAGTYTFTPGAGFAAMKAGESVTFNLGYRIEDGNGGADTAVLSLTVNGLNEGPVAEDDAAAGDEAVASLSGNVLANDSDPNGEALTVTEVAGQAPGTAIAVSATLAGGRVVQGTVTVQADGSWTFLPVAGFAAMKAGEQVSFALDYTAEDPHGAADSATLTITIDGLNEGPVAEDDAASDDDQVVTIAGNVMANDSDPNGEAITVTEAGGAAPGAAIAVSGTSANGLALSGTVTIAADGSYVFTADPGFGAMAADDTISFAVGYRIADVHGAEDDATLTITIDGLNDGPDAVDDAFATTEDTAVSGNLLANDSDPNGDAISVTSITLGGQTYAVAPGAAIEVTGVTLASGLVGDLSVASDGSFTFTPTGGFDALDDGEADMLAFDYTIADSYGATDTASVAIEVAGESSGGGGGGGGGGDEPSINIAFVVDASSSMTAFDMGALLPEDMLAPDLIPIGNLTGDQDGDGLVDDIDGNGTPDLDGVANTPWDIAFFAVKSFVAELQALVGAGGALEGTTLNIALIGYDSVNPLSPGDVASVTVCFDGDQAFVEWSREVFLLQSDGNSVADVGLEAAVEWFDGVGADLEDDNQIVLISDGEFSAPNAQAIRDAWIAEYGGDLHARHAGPLPWDFEAPQLGVLEALNTGAIDRWDEEGKFFIADLAFAENALNASDILRSI